MISEAKMRWLDQSFLIIGIAWQHDRRVPYLSLWGKRLRLAGVIAIVYLPIVVVVVVVVVVVQDRIVVGFVARFRLSGPLPNHRLCQRLKDTI